ncbi:alkaline phosphatase family protein [Candidatus Woesearchaeota archaeon]|nr:alkaline phosphatase family protein [Candidatus Woesearchaeota archaeon]MBT4150487.1 alkaline phosphatase family protein [Candidatus Woesearchaeota archaeon]MBT4247127.1 alkaline phosphatase family protein [Candidatus Woesearchaeota archaeon]MBT4434647.1 alkaline phosphatase family protein [Candidatus Woesearchaeota archaeon]MBT7332621.1 alkaline phosphatase family protein [Candidatus Woesearchaeota archaeon]
MVKVIVVGIDGLGGRYINSQNAPFISSLFKKGTYTTKMENVAITTSAPNWTSLLSGVDSKKHGIVDENWKSRRDKSLPFPTILDFLYNTKKDFSIFYSGSVKRSIEKNIVLKSSYHTKWSLSDQGSLRNAISQINKKQPDFLFLHFDLVDVFGHIFGYGSKLYNWMARRTDSKVKKLVDLLHQKKLMENTTLIITSDHGGIKRNHGGNTPEEKETFFVIVGPNVNQNKTIKFSSIVDITPTITHILNLEKKDYWDGKLIKEIFN